jgi:hypothetical protein
MSTALAFEDGDKKPSRTVAERTAAAALRLKTAGATWEEIAEISGYKNAENAKAAIEKALVKELRDDPESKKIMRGLADLRLESLLRAVWVKAHDPEHPEQLAAVGKARELIADYRKMHGLDSPVEISVTNPTVHEIEAWVAEQSIHLVPDVQEDDIFEAEVVEPQEIEAPPEPEPSVKDF